MKKIVLITISSSTLIFSSCKRDECHECHYDKAGTTVEMGEFCGDALENLESQGTYTDTTGTYDVHCHGH